MKPEEIRQAAENDLLFYKFCGACQTLKTSSEFSNNKSRKDGKATQCKLCHAAYIKTRLKNDPTFKVKSNEYCRKYRKSNPEYVKFTKTWNTLNRGRRNFLTSKRRAAKINATPKWLTQEQKTKIADFYWMAKDLQAVTGEVYEVDHIIPLQGKNVCGLHVPWNLQILPADLNRKKSNVEPSL